MVLKKFNVVGSENNRQQIKDIFNHFPSKMISRNWTSFLVEARLIVSINVKGKHNVMDFVTVGYNNKADFYFL